MKTEYVSYDQDEKILSIDFNSLLNRTDQNHNGVIKINQRAFYGIMDLVTLDLNDIFKRYEEFALIYNETKFFISLDNRNGNLTPKKLMFHLKSRIINDKKLISIIDELIEEEYTLDLDSNKNVKGNVNTELQVTDYINKVLIKGSVLMRLLIPLICILDFEKKSNGNPSENFKYNLFYKCIIVFDDNKNNSLNKLEKVIKSRVKRTKYSDVVIWEYLRNLGFDTDIVSRQILKAVTAAIIPKLTRNKSSISYLDVVIKDKLRFIFTYDYPINYKTIKINSDGEGLEEKEKIEINLLKADEGVYMLNLCSIKLKVKEFEERYSFSEEQITNMERKLNGAHKILLSTYFNKIDIAPASKRQKAILSLGMIEDLKDKNFKIFPAILNSTLDDSIKKMNKKKTIEKITKTKEYEKVLESYVAVLSVIIKQNPIIKMITMKNYRFVDDDNREIDINIDEFAIEVLDLISLI